MVCEDSTLITSKKAQYPQQTTSWRLVYGGNCAPKTIDHGAGLVPSSGTMISFL
jgi:hypothetical protein